MKKALLVFPIVGILIMLPLCSAQAQNRMIAHNIVAVDTSYLRPQVQLKYQFSGDVLRPYWQNQDFLSLPGRNHLDYDEQGNLRIQEYYVPSDKYNGMQDCNFRNSLQWGFSLKKKKD